MQEIDEVGAHRLRARLRGVDVDCSIAYDTDGTPAITVEVHASEVSPGLRDVSQFAGYCERTLVLTSASDDDAAWAGVLASYYGFGLARIDNDNRVDIMRAPTLGATGDGDMRAAFVRRVLALLPDA